MTALTVTPENSESTLLGKKVNSLQSSINISKNGVVSGTLYHVEGFTGFSGDPEEQEGNYLALRIDTPAETDEVITVELIGGTLGHPVTLDEDRNIILRISDKDTQSIEINATDGVNTVTRTLTLTGLKLISG